jgi:hypothetical protein
VLSGFQGDAGHGLVLAHTIAHETEHPLIRHLALDRFERNNGFDEYGTGLWTYKQ